MKQRVITAVIGVPLLFLIIFLGNWALAVLVAVLTFAALYEFCNALNKFNENKINVYFLAVLSAIILVLMKLDFYAIPFGIVICFLSIMGYEVLSKDPSFTRAAQEIFFLIYIPLIFGFLMMFENALGGKWTIWMCFLAPFATDTFAYFGGRKFGGKKLIAISPNKTISGALSGLLATVVVLTLYGLLINFYTEYYVPFYFYAILGIITSIAGQIGDISASLIKRTYDIKDFGHILPGHGGILDRFDSILFTIPIVYMFTYYFLG